MYKIISIVLFGFVLSGCAVKSINGNSEISELKKENINFNASNMNQQITLDKKTDINNKNSLLDKRITVVAVNVNLAQAVQVISKASGFNLVIEDTVNPETKVSISLNKAKITEVLNSFTYIANCSYEINGDIIYIKKTTERSFSIPYTQAVSNFDSTIGGDVFGGGESSSGSSSSSGGNGLKGKFGLNFKSPADSNDFYKQLEQNLQTMISKDGKIVLNKFTGTLIVTDVQKNLDKIEDFINKIKKTSKKQVIIDAKILEVVLNDSHQLGVDWSTLPSAGDFMFNQTLGLSNAVAGTLSYSDKHMNAIVKALDTSGDIDTLSNPKIIVSSGQSALISSGKILPFWEKEVTYTSSGVISSPTIPIVTYKRRDILDGLSLGVTPTITDDNKIILNVIPITSNIEDTINLTDPGVSGDSSVIASAPVLSVKEAGTVINAEDNQVVVIGGLISNSKKKQIKSVPFFSQLPFIGDAFKQSDIKNEKRELVILLKINVIN